MVEVVRLRTRYEELKLLRSSLDGMLKDTQRYVRPNSPEFDHGANFKNDGSKDIHDDTAVWSNQMFANGLSSNLIPKAEKWMYLRVQDTENSELNKEQHTYLNTVTDRIFHEFALPQSQFYGASHECFLDIGAYGTSPVQMSDIKGVVNFRARPLSDVFFDVDEHGEVNTVYYRCFKTTRQLVGLLPEVVNVEGFSDKDKNKKWELVYSIEPNQDTRAKKGGRIGVERPFKVTYWSPDLKAPIRQDGSSYFTFLVPRWAKQSDEVYGRSPAMTCLSHIRVLNKMVKEVMISAEYLNAPTLTAEEDSILLPIKYGARQIMFHEAGSEKPQPIMNGSQPQYVMQMIESYKASIQRAFFVDQIIREQKRERQSILEIQDTRGQMLQQLSPLLNRMESEYIAPAVESTFMFLNRRRQLPDIPSSLNGAKLEVAYASPSSQAQFASRLSDISAFMQDITPLANVKPEILQAVNERELLDSYAKYRNISPSVIKSSEEMQQQQAAQAEQQQAAQMTQSMPDVAGAMKDVAQARQADPEGVGQLLNI